MGVISIKQPKMKKRTEINIIVPNGDKPETSTQLTRLCDKVVTVMKYPKIMAPMMSIKIIQDNLRLSLRPSTNLLQVNSRLTRPITIAPAVPMANLVLPSISILNQSPSFSLKFKVKVDRMGKRPQEVKLDGRYTPGKD